MRKALLSATALLGLLVVQGCLFLPFPHLRTGRTIPEEQVRSIVPGQTTKDELFTRLGAPAAIVGSGEVVVLNAPRVFAWPSAGLYEYRSSSEPYFTLFAPQDGRVADRRIYYYRHVYSTNFFYYFAVIFFTHGKTATDQLWVMMDERRNLVVDYAYKQYEQSVIFGRARGAESRSE